MSYFISLLTALLFTNMLFAQPVKLRLRGQMGAESKSSELLVQKFEGKNIEVPLQGGRRFSFVSGNLDKGFYQTNLPATLYLSPGFDLLVVPLNTGGYRYEGAGALENNSLQKARKALPLFIAADGAGKLKQAAYLLDPPVFIQKLDSFLQYGQQLFARSNDSFFVRYAQVDLELYGQNLIGRYLAGFGMDLKKKELAEKKLDAYPANHPRFLGIMDSLMQPARIKTLTYADRVVLAKRLFRQWKEMDETAFRSMPSFRQAVEAHLQTLLFKYISNLKQPFKPEDLTLVRLKAVRKEVNNPFIRAYFEHQYTRSLLKEIKDSAKLQRYYNDYIASTTHSGYLADMKVVFERAMAYADNKSAPDFGFRDAAGKQVSLSGLRGSYVYIDVWATWCGPCIAEIPALKKLSADYTGKNIRFVSISVDELKELQKWKNFVRSKGLGGIQLIADKAFESYFIQAMQIDAIPRFILIDPTGKIISGNALRPSNKALREQLNGFLL